MSVIEECFELSSDEGNKSSSLFGIFKKSDSPMEILAFKNELFVLHQSLNISVFDLSTRYIKANVNVQV